MDPSPRSKHVEMKLGKDDSSRVRDNVVLATYYIEQTRLVFCATDPSIFVRADVADKTRGPLETIDSLENIVPAYNLENP